MASATIEDTGSGTWRVRWNQKIDGKWKSKEKAVQGTRHDAEEMRLYVIRALEDVGYVDLSRPAHRGPGNLLDGVIAYLDAQAAMDVIDERTRDVGSRRVKVIARGLYAVTNTPTDRPLPVTLLSRSLFMSALVWIKSNHGEETARRALSILHRAWGWMAEDPKAYPGVPVCPQSARGLVPSAPVYGRTIAPTMAHADACIRHLSAHVAQGRKRATKNELLVIAILCRYTGLRISQVMGIDRADLDVANRTLTVRKGKSAQEQADMRTIPLARSLFQEPAIVAWLQTLPESGPVILRGGSKVDIVMKAAWQAATDAGEVPEAVWNPQNRKNARPDHAYRAMMIDTLRRMMPPEGISPGIWADVRPWLVGQTGEMSATHYGSELDEAGRRAVDALPAIDWTGPQVQGSNVVRLHG